jgi:hypothetical protein
MEIVLPSGHKVTLKDKLKRGDRVDGEQAVAIVIGADGSRRVDGAIASAVTARLLRRAILWWDFDGPWPSQASSFELGQRILDDLDEDDAAALEAAVEPWVQKVLAPNRGNTVTHIPTGVQMRLVNPDDAAKLAAYQDEFTVPESTGPKSSGTGITSPGSPALSGPEPGADQTP